MTTLVACGLLSEAGVDHVDRFGEAFDPDVCRIPLLADRGVVHRQPPGPDPDFQSTTRNDVEGSKVLRDNGGVSRLVVEHQGAERQGRRHHRGRRQRDDWR